MIVNNNILLLTLLLSFDDVKDINHNGLLEQDIWNHQLIDKKLRIGKYIFFIQIPFDLFANFRNKFLQFYLYLCNLAI